MKLKFLAALALSAVLLLSGCAAPAQSETTPESSSSASETTAVSERVITDSYGTKTELPDDPCVVSLYGSFAECWLLSGGKLTGITEDAVDEHGIEIDDDTALVGTVMEPNLESIAALSPDYVILSADLPAHAELDAALTDMQIPHGYFHMDNVMDYAKIMLNFCAVNDPNGEKYDENVTQVLKRIESIKQETAEKLSGQNAPTVLLLRAYSTGVKAKGEDTVAGAILKELGAHNIADDDESLLEDLSLESVIEADPDYILVMTMGSEENAKTYMAENIENNPAWVAILFGLLLAVLFSGEMDVLSLGDETAQSLGMPVQRTRFLLLMTASLLAGGAVSFSGLLGFVGLIVPHILRHFIGSRHRILVPLSALFGASFVLLCDTLSRTLFSPYEIPVGIVLSLLGGPFFLFLIVRKKGGKLE